MNPGQARVEVAPETTDTPLPAEVLATLTEIGEGVNSSLDLDEVLARKQKNKKERLKKNETNFNLKIKMNTYN